MGILQMRGWILLSLTYPRTSPVPQCRDEVPTEGTARAGFPRSRWRDENQNKGCCIRNE